MDLRHIRPDVQRQRQNAIRNPFSKSAESEIRRDLPEIYPRLWRWAVSLTGSQDQGSDLAQQTALRAIEKADLYQPGTRLDAWMFQMAKRIWLNELRSQAIRRGGGLVPIEDEPQIDKSVDTETNIFAREVLSKLNTLPEAQRMTATLVYAEGFRYKEAADILEVPIGTVMSRLAAARSRLAEWQEDKGTGTQ